MKIGTVKLHRGYWGFGIQKSPGSVNLYFGPWVVDIWRRSS